MKVLVLGAAGKTGRHLVKQAVAKGHEVTAFVRSAEEADFPANVKVVTGDARNAADVTAAMQGQEAVVSALGSMKAGDELIIRSTRALLAAAKQTGVKRVVMLSSFLLLSNFKKNLLITLMGKMMKGILEDKASGEDLLKASDLNWTIVYATALDRAPAGGPVRVVMEGDTVGMASGIARADVAEFMLNTLDSTEYDRRPVLITVK